MSLQICRPKRAQTPLLPAQIPSLGQAKQLVDIKKLQCFSGPSRVRIITTRSYPTQKAQERTDPDAHKTCHLQYRIPPLGGKRKLTRCHFAADFRQWLQLIHFTLQFT
jgi:hypothetical protein